MMELYDRDGRQLRYGSGEKNYRKVMVWQQWMASCAVVTMKGTMWHGSNRRGVVA